MSTTPDNKSQENAEFERAAALVKIAREGEAYVEHQKKMLEGFRNFFCSPEMRALMALEDRHGRLLFAEEVDQRLRWRRGTALKLAASGELKSVQLPDGSIRFRSADIDAILAH